MHFPQLIPWPWLNVESTGVHITLYLLACGACELMCALIVAIIIINHNIITEIVMKLNNLVTDAMRCGSRSSPPTSRAVTTVDCSFTFTFHFHFLVSFPWLILIYTVRTALGSFHFSSSRLVSSHLISSSVISRSVLRLLHFTVAPISVMIGNGILI